MFASKRSRGLRPVRALVATTGSAALMFGTVFVGTSAAAENQPPNKMMDNCAYGELCIWEQPNAGGQQVNLSKCGEKVNLRDLGYTGVGSFVNNQTENTTAAFFGPLPEDPDGPPQFQYDSTAPDIREDTTDLNTYIVQAC